jgi:hypothetical protein
MTLKDLDKQSFAGFERCGEWIKERDIKADIIKTCKKCPKCSEAQTCEHNWITNTAGYKPFTYCYDCGIMEGSSVFCAGCKALMEWGEITEADLK